MNHVSTLMEWKTQGRAEGFAEGMAAGMLEARRSDLLKLLRVKFSDMPYELTGSIRGMTDLDQVGRWFEAALVAPSTDLFRIMANDADGRGGIQEELTTESQRTQRRKAEKNETGWSGPNAVRPTLLCSSSLSSSLCSLRLCG